MSNVLKFPERSCEHLPEEPSAHVEPPRRPQVEDGYTRTANVIVEAFARSNLTSREARVIRVVERMTYGWHKAEDWIAASVISEMTGISEGKCSETLNGLIRKRVLTRNGGGRSPVRINKNVDEWDFKAQKARVTPKRKPESKWGDSPQDGVSESPQNGVTPKERKEINTPSNEGEVTAVADDHPGEPEQTARQNTLPDCPHTAILDQWAEIMPDKRQPIRSIWGKGQRARHLAARWKSGFSIINEKTGEPLYTDLQSGIAWWGRFLRFLRRSEFLMRDDSRFFGLEWIARQENFTKILELKYHGGDA